MGLIAQLITARLRVLLRYLVAWRDRLGLSRVIVHLGHIEHVTDHGVGLFVIDTVCAIVVRRDSLSHVYDDRFVSMSVGSTAIVLVVIGSIVELMSQFLIDNPTGPRNKIVFSLILNLSLVRIRSADMLFLTLMTPTYGTLIIEMMRRRSCSVYHTPIVSGTCSKASMAHII